MIYYCSLIGAKIIELSDSTKTIILIIIKSSIEYVIKQKYSKHFEPIDTKNQKPNSKMVYFTKERTRIT